MAFAWLLWHLPVFNQPIPRQGAELVFNPLLFLIECGIVFVSVAAYGPPTSVSLFSCMNVVVYGFRIYVRNDVEVFVSECGR